MALDLRTEVRAEYIHMQKARWTQRENKEEKLGEGESNHDEVSRER